jgi:glycosyltransferase involved in cell wall biosynthesis
MTEKRKIRVLECIRQGKIGGGESHLLDLVENLDKTRFEPVVLSFTDGPMIKRLNDMGVKSHIIYTEKPFDFTKWKAVKKLLIDEKIDLVHAHGTRANSNVNWAARSLGIPVAYTIHGWSFHQDQNFLLRNLRIMGEKYLTSRTNLNISISDSNQKAGKKYIRGFKSRMIRYGVNTQRFNPAGQYVDIRKELDIPADKVLVVFVARVTHHKQPLALVKAFAEAVAVHPGLHLLMVGDGDQKEQVVELVKNLNISEHVTLQPFRQDVPAVLASADVFVLPSLWEGLPLGLLEAMTMGKAIIASNVDGTCDVIEHYKDGILVETDKLVNNLVEPLITVGKDANLRKDLQTASLETAHKRFSIVSMMNDVEQIYLDLLHGGSQSR